MNTRKYEQQQKRKVLKILEELSKRIRTNELAVTSFGFWSSSVSNQVTFRIIVLSREKEKEIHDFEQI